MSEPPFIDEHAIAFAATPDRAWNALLGVVPSAFCGRAPTAVAGLLGCRPLAAAGPRPLVVGSTVPGFCVVEAKPARRLALEGRHRFSHYRLVFRIEDLRDGRCRLAADTFATFPGPHGRAYRALVVGSRAHVAVVRRLLARVARRASGGACRGEERRG